MIAAVFNGHFRKGLRFVNPNVVYLKMESSFIRIKKARFIFEQEKSEPEPAGGEYPLILLTGRGTSAQWHTQTRTAKSELLKKMYPKDVYVEISPEDARQRKISQHAWVYVTTRRDTVKARAFIIPTVKAGQIFMSMHYPETNRLTFPSFDPYSRQPSYKNCAVDVRKDLY